MPKINAVIFSCHRDRDLDAIPRAWLSSLGVETRVAYDADEFRPLDFKAGALATRFPRHGNLNGMQCVTGILRTMRNMGHDADWVIKNDADTLPTTAFLNALLDDSVEAVGTAFGIPESNDLLTSCPWSGTCYALRTRNIPTLLGYAHRLADFPLCAEDRMVHRLLTLAGLPFRRLRLGFWDFRRNAPDLREAEVITFGTTHLLPDSWRKSGRARSLLIETMEHFSQTNAPFPPYAHLGS